MTNEQEIVMLKKQVENLTIAFKELSRIVENEIENRVHIEYDTVVE